MAKKATSLNQDLLITPDMSLVAKELKSLEDKLKKDWTLKVGIKVNSAELKKVERLIDTLSQAGKAGGGIDRLTARVQQLGLAVSNLNSSKLTSFANALAGLKTSQQGIKNVKDALSTLSGSALSDNAAKALKAQQGMLNSLSRSSKQLGPVTQQLGAIQQAMSALVGSVGANRSTNAVTNFFNAMSRGTKDLLNITMNISSVTAAIDKLVNKLAQLKAAGTLSLLRNLPGNMGYTEKGGVRMSPIKIVAPNEAEWVKIRDQMEQRFQRRPITARIRPEMDNQGWQKFQNLLIALSFGQFEQSMRAMAKSMVNSFSTIESSQATLSTVYRDRPGRADQVFNYLKQKEMKSPFSFQEILEGGTQFAVLEKRLNRLGFNVEQMMDMSTELAAAFGQGKPDAIMGIQTGISRLLSGDQNGFEILDRFGISRSTLRDAGLTVGPQGIPLKSDADIKRVIETIQKFQMGVTGGNLAERRNDTISGMISNLQSQIMYTSASIFEPVKEDFQNVVRMLNKFLKAIEELPAPVRKMIGHITLAGAAFMAVAQQISSFGLVLLGLQNAGFFAGLRSSPVGAMAGSAVAGAIGSRAGAGWANTAVYSAGGAAAKGADPMLLAAMAGGGWNMASNTIKGPPAGAMQKLFPTLFAGMGAVGGVFSKVGTAIALAGAKLFAAMSTVATISGSVAAIFATLALSATAILGGIGLAGVAIGTYREKQNTDSQAAGSLTDFRKGVVSSDFKRAAEIANMSDEELDKSGLSQSDVEKARKTVAQIRSSGRIGKDSSQFLEADKKALQETEDVWTKLNDKATNYLNIKNRLVEITEAEYEVTRKRLQAEVELGRQSPTVLLDQARLELRTAEENYQKSVNKKESENTLKMQYQIVLDKMLAVKKVQQDLNALASKEIDIRLEGLKAVGKARPEDEIRSLREKRNLIDTSTPQGRLEAQQIDNQIVGMGFTQKQASRSRKISLIEASGDTLGGQIMQIQMDKEAQIRESLASERGNIEKLANKKIENLRREHYMNLIGMAGEQKTALSEIEMSRVSNERSLLEGEIGRGSFDEVLSADKKMTEFAQKQVSLLREKQKLEIDLMNQRQNAETKAMNSRIRSTLDAGGDPSRLYQEQTVMKSRHKNEKSSLLESTKQAIKEAEQVEKFRKDDLDRQKTSIALEVQEQDLTNKKMAAELEVGRTKKDYIKHLEDQLQLELEILDTKIKAVEADKTLTKEQKRVKIGELNQQKAQAKNQTTASAAEAGNAQMQNTISGLQTVIDDPKTSAQKKLQLLKQQLELEKRIRYNKYQADVRAPGANAQKLQAEYLRDINELQRKYLGLAEQTTNEIEKQNQALIDRYHNKDGPKSGIFHGSFTMGETFGIDQLGENMATDSAYSKMKYDKMKTGSGFDPFSKDRYDVRAYQNQAQQDSYTYTGGAGAGNVPTTKGEIKIVNELRIVGPDGKLTVFKDAYNEKNVPPGKGPR